MNTFDQAYFSSHYRSSEDKSSLKKLRAYVGIIRHFIPEGREQTLLDVGCGYGHFLRIAEDYFTTYGIDPSKYVLTHARRSARHTTFETATLASFWSKRKYDVITAFDVLEHTPDVNASLKKVKSLLKQRGIFVCVVPVYDGIVGGIGGLLDRDPTHVQKLSRWKWLELFQRYFVVTEKQGAIRYSLPGGIYLHVLFPWLFPWGQAILVVLKKR